MNSHSAAGGHPQHAVPPTADGPASSMDPVTLVGGDAALLADSLISQSAAELSQRLVNVIVDMRLHTD